MSVTVSVLMPVYNVGNYVRAAIKSILNQSYTDFEFIIIDDASTDNTVQEIRKFKDSRIRLFINKVNKGLAANLNEGFRLSKGEYIVIMDGDDISYPQRIVTQLRFMRNNPEVGISGTWIKLFGYTSIVHKYPLTDQACRTKLLFNTPFAHPSVIFKRDIVINHNLYYDESLKQYGEDYTFWLKASKVTKFANIPQVLLWYRTFVPKSKEYANGLRAAQGRRLREETIQELGFTLSAQGKECLHAFALKKKLSNEQITLSDIETFVLNLEKHYEKSKSHDLIEFRKTIGEIWFYLCYNQRKVYVIRTYFYSGLRKYYAPPVLLQAKFIFRQFLSY